MKKKQQVDMQAKHLSQRLNGYLNPLSFCILQNLISIESVKKQKKYETEPMSTSQSSKTFKTVATQTMNL
jgi:hypothetical protein